VGFYSDLKLVSIYLQVADRFREAYLGKLRKSGTTNEPNFDGFLA